MSFCLALVQSPCRKSCGAGTEHTGWWQSQGPSRPPPPGQGLHESLQRAGGGVSKDGLLLARTPEAARPGRHHVPLALVTFFYATSCQGRRSESCLGFVLNSAPLPSGPGASGRLGGAPGPSNPLGRSPGPVGASLLTLQCCTCRPSAPPSPPRYPPRSRDPHLGSRVLLCAARGPLPHLFAPLVRFSSQLTGLHPETSSQGRRVTQAEGPPQPPAQGGSCKPPGPQLPSI